MIIRRTGREEAKGDRVTLVLTRPSAKELQRRKAVADGSRRRVGDLTHSDLSTTRDNFRRETDAILVFFSSSSYSLLLNRL